MLLLISVFACTKDPVDSAADTQVESTPPDSPTETGDTAPEIPDADEDGYAEDVDCDDHNDRVHPDAVESCNEVDDDCDDAVDESVGDLWYDDADGDLHGDPSTERQGCEAEGGVASSDDCDDSDTQVHPGAAETCDGVDQDCDAQVDEDAADAPEWFIDYDGDGDGDDAYTIESCEQPEGYTDNDDDCDDTDATVNTAAEEVCDAVDNDCDGRTDPDDSVDAPSWFIDYDGDGEGSSDYRYTSCRAPTGYVDNGLDCDDTDAEVNTSAEEVCDDIDNDCDGDIDDDDSDGPEGSTWYADADGDGYGDSSTTDEGCAQPSGYVDNDEDCDDSDADVNPDASEVCDADDVDEDCSGDADDADSGVTDATTWYTDSDGDGYGDAGASTTACDQPTGTVEDATDCDDADADVNPGATEVCDADDVDEDCDGDVDGDDADVSATTWYEDGDGDGYGDAGGSTTSSCEEPSGYAETADDCDDDDAAVNPGASETCNNVDDDCDGDVDSAAACSDCDFQASGGHNYLFCTDSTRTWTDALSTCQGWGYSLVTVDDSSENSWLASTHSGIGMGTPWIGFNDRSSEGSWVWASGASVSYTNWGSGEPNDSGGEDCGEIYTSGAWNDIPCGNSDYYICESE